MRESSRRHPYPSPAPATGFRGAAPRARLRAWGRAIAVLLLLPLLSACASTGYRSPGDPLEPLNRKVFVFNDRLDRWVVQPVARTYVEYTPKLVRASFTNFFDNVEYPNTILNQFLQGRFAQGFSDIGRFVVNTVVGFGGMFDPASRFGLPEHDEDLGQTLARWGVGQGPYLVLPFIGPDTLRNLPNLATSALTSPLFYINSAAITMPVGTVSLINKRANAGPQIEMVRQALDPYIFMREAYLQHRRFLIYNGHPPVRPIDELGPGGLIPPPPSPEAPAGNH